mgnify:FL=1
MADGFECPEISQKLEYVMVFLVKNYFSRTHLYGSFLSQTETNRPNKNQPTLLRILFFPHEKWSIPHFEISVTNLYGIQINTL